MLRTYNIGNKVVEVEPYYSFPCGLMIFTINGIDACKSEFGTTYDSQAWNAPDYGCGCSIFERDTNEKNRKMIMKKYSLTPQEFDGICDVLEEILYVGRCGWCV